MYAIKPQVMQSGRISRKSLTQFQRDRCRECIHADVHSGSLLAKEKDHVEGFAPEVAWVTHGGLETSGETLYTSYIRDSVL